ncbi:MAG: exosortase/archaeosortase family protein [Promethearchaeota archaeon]|nr:MAG: exosortase/archaeosortase family protein [Candidatus Lokiarchaeota archaeon]
MNSVIKKKITVWIIVSINLVIAFFSGLLIPEFEIIYRILFGFVIIPALIAFDFFILDLLTREFKPLSISKKITIWVFLCLNLLFAFIIGSTIPYMESNAKYNMGVVMIPLLIILNYIIVDRFHFYLKNTEFKDGGYTTRKNEHSQIKDKKPIIEFNGKTYIFSIRSLIILAVGAPLLSYGIYQFFDTPFNFWLHEIVVKQTVFFLNLLFNMGAESAYAPVGTHHWSFEIPNRGKIYFQTFCTGIQAICVFAALILLIPHSQDSETSHDIIWRKTKALIISSAIFYVVNIIRMIIQIYLYYIGYAWEDIHYSISAASSFIAAIIILLLHKWIPEFIISILYGGALVDKKIKENRKETISEMIKQSHKVPLNLIRKVLKMDKKTYQNNMISWASKFGYSIKGDFLIIPEDRVEKFLEMLAWEKSFEKEGVN